MPFSSKYIKFVCFVEHFLKKIQVQEVLGVRHIAFYSPDKLWVGYERTIALINGNGENIKEIRRYRFTFGAHTVTKEGYLIYFNGVGVQRYMSETNSQMFINEINVDDWKARCIFASHRSGSIIVGHQNEKKSRGKLSVYDKEGNHRQTIEEYKNGEPMFSWPRYITDNINGDIVTSDWYNGIIVIDQAGHHRFRYSLSTPRAVVTDSKGRIFCCSISPKIHVIDQNGKFLLDIDTGSKNIFALCLDQNEHLYAGNDEDKTIIVYKV